MNLCSFVEVECSSAGAEERDLIKGLRYSNTSSAAHLGEHVELLKNEESQGEAIQHLAFQTRLMLSRTQDCIVDDAATS